MNERQKEQKREAINKIVNGSADNEDVVENYAGVGYDAGYRNGYDDARRRFDSPQE